MSTSFFLWQMSDQEYKVCYVKSCIMNSMKYTAHYFDIQSDKLMFILLNLGTQDQHLWTIFCDIRQTLM